MDVTHLPGQPTAHPDHDTMLVAALAAGDLAGRAKDDAETLVAACPECAVLHADLLAIAAATRALPAPARTRDYRLTAGQAARLRPSGRRRVLAAFASPRLAVTRPLAVAFTTLGLAGLLLTALPAGGPLGMSSGGAEERAMPSDQGLPLDDGGVVPGDLPVPAFAGREGDKDAGSNDAGQAVAPESVDGPDDRDTGATKPAPVPGPGPWLLALSLAFLSGGIGLFAARRLGRLD